jgi:hypothetical protein
MPRHPRAPGTTRRKFVWFTPEIVARVAGWAADQYRGLKQVARLTAYETVSRRVSREGLAQLAALLRAPVAEDATGAGAAPVTG